MSGSRGACDQRTIVLARRRGNILIDLPSIDLPRSQDVESVSPAPVRDRRRGDRDRSKGGVRGPNPSSLCDAADCPHRDAVGGNKVDYGVTVVTDANGNDVGKVHTTEDDNTIGVGMNAAQALENAGLALGHRLPPISHFADVSLGHTWKRVKYREEGTAAFFGSASVNERDRGYLLRVTPYDAIGYPGMVPWLESILRVKIEASYGAAEQNDGDRVVTYSTGTTLPVIQDHRQGRAFRVGIAFPQSVENSWHREGRSWIYELLTPLVSYGSTSERSQRYLRGNVAGDEVNRRGWEITVANIFSYREGHVDDPTSTVIGQTFGWGVGLHLGDLAGVQYDHATVPQSVYLANVKRNGFSLHLDPVRVIRGLR